MLPSSLREASTVGKCRNQPISRNGMSRTIDATWVSRAPSHINSTISVNLTVDKNGVHTRTRGIGALYESDHPNTPALAASVPIQLLQTTPFSSHKE